MAVFTRPPPKKRRIAQNARVLAQQSATSSSGSGSSIAANSTAESNLPPLDELDEALEIPGELIDEGMEQHDTVEVQKAVGIAIEEMANRFHLRLSDAELKEAQEVFPKAAGFANQIHGSGTLRAMFTDIRNACKSSGLLNTEKEVPMQRVVTRWGADAACANTHLELRPVVEAMTSRPGLKLSKFHSSSTQWDMLDECGECLQIFEEAPHVHSQTGVALIHQVILHILLMIFRLGLIRDAVHDPTTEQPPLLVSRVAAVAAIHVLNKYLKLLEAAHIYWLAIVLCPWYKIQWLETHGYSLAHIDRVRRVLYDRFADCTVRFGPRPEPIAHGEAAPTQTSNRPRRHFMQVPSASVQPTVFQAVPLSSPLSIYLASPPVAEIEVQKVGGLVQYWENESNTPSGCILGKMALDILTAPSSSIDVERAFSGGRMAINYRQHRTSVGTFRAKMAVGSWFGTPLLSGAEEVYEMLDGKGSSESPEPLD
ncbi:hypothetical protein RSOL_293340 [Rhizoctonia solani AG-3 Rhs1AP]|uniref:HAT C-terminal dimerisation domain-containing protein n=1 Tax=Rhizoctonia solani AG-3 Rhs1AP TaxID=1086054 RepID=A0A0A1ULA2_9AGAM|nr:hypothetical protein RSOL_293340 [Rhizoctonia solani AG-3 Rhs1AP]